MTGLLVEEGDVPGLADALCEVLSARSRSLAMGRAGRERAASLYTAQARGAAVEAFLTAIRRLPPA
jgi:glycosyltransferase involved in cell wall biosynthesis